jgi:hypothetical protein
VAGFWIVQPAQRWAGFFVAVSTSLISPEHFVWVVLMQNNGLGYNLPMVGFSPQCPGRHESGFFMGFPDLIAA